MEKNNNKNVLSVVFNEFKNDNRVLNQALSISDGGYSVTIIAIEMGSLLPLKEKINNIQLIRFFKGYGNQKIFSIYIFQLLYNFIKFNYKFYSFVLRDEHDVIHCHDLNTLQFGIVSKLFKGKSVKLIYDAHEYETQRNLLHGLKQRMLIIKEKFLIRYCDRVVTVSNTIAEEYSRLYNIPKPTVILNCPVIDPESEIVRHDIFREKFNISDSTKIFLYQGYFSVGRGIEIILEAFNELNFKDIALVFMGEGAMIKEIKSNELYENSVYIHPFVASDEIIKHTSSADYGISFIEDISLSDRYCLPNKLFEYIAAGLPVITSGLPEMEKFVKIHGVGVSSNENSVSGFVEAFGELINMDREALNKNIIKTRKKYNWSTQEKILLNLYENLITESVKN